MTADRRTPSRYDTFGVGYQHVRREDPWLAARIRAAVGPARTIVNVGAGTGGYEPSGRTVVAVEPSTMMIGQRPAGAAPVVRASAEALPFGDGCFDAGLALWTVHHWSDPVAGIAQLRRVARRVVVVAGSDVLTQMWLVRDYFPDVAAFLRPDIRPQALADLLGGDVRVEPLPVPWDCRDGFAEAFWARPEAYLDATIRSGMSAFRLLDPAKVDAGVRQLRADLRSGVWQARNGHLRDLRELDCGLRLITATGAGPNSRFGSRVSRADSGRS